MNSPNLHREQYQAVRPVEGDELREALRLSLVLAALENLMKYDTDRAAHAVYRSRYLELTDGGLPA